MTTASSEGLLTARTWAVPAYPLALPASSWTQRTAPAGIPNPTGSPSPGHGCGSFLRGCSSPLLLNSLKAQTDPTVVWQEEQHSFWSFPK